MKIEKFESHDHKPYPSVSDHCGLSIDLEIELINFDKETTLERSP